MNGAEHPLLMKGDLVVSTIEGRKLETRRVPPKRYLKWKRGDLVYVRETFYCDDYQYPEGPRDELLAAMEYRASHNCAAWEAGCPCRNDDGNSMWRSALHLPKWASRLWLELTGDVRVEPLQSLGAGDAFAEGIAPAGWKFTSAELIDRFASLWDSINAARGYSWKSNPEVAVIQFKVVSTTGRPT